MQIFAIINSYDRWSVLYFIFELYTLTFSNAKFIDSLLESYTRSGNSILISLEPTDGPCSRGFFVNYFYVDQVAGMLEAVTTADCSVFLEK